MHKNGCNKKNKSAQPKPVNPSLHKCNLCSDWSCDTPMGSATTLYNIYHNLKMRFWETADCIHLYRFKCIITNY